jgi:hypothetical protein
MQPRSPLGQRLHAQVRMKPPPRQRQSSRYYFDYALVVLVQLFMLLHAGLFYVLLHWRARRRPAVYTVSETDPLLRPRTISVVIPVYNELHHIGPCIRNVVENVVLSMDHVQIICVDAGGSDDSMATAVMVAKNMGLRLMTTSSRGGRGPALNAGVRLATGDVILTLHADTRLPRGWDAAVIGALASRGVLSTAFSFGTDRSQLADPASPPVGLDFMEYTVNLRSRWFELPLGDQALAFTAATLNAVGGFPDFPILEEYELVQRLRALGAAGAGPRPGGRSPLCEWGPGQRAWALLECEAGADDCARRASSLCFCQAGL